MDPIGYGGKDTNVFRYLSNNTILYIDPQGLQGWIDDICMMGSYIWSNPFAAAREYQKGVAQGANDIFIQPVYRSGQACVDVIGFDFIDDYTPYNPHLAGYINGDRTGWGATGSIVLDGTSACGVVGMARGSAATVLLRSRCASVGRAASSEALAIGNTMSKTQLRKNGGQVCAIANSNCSKVVIGNNISKATVRPPIPVTTHCAESHASIKAFEHGIIFKDSIFATVRIGGRQHAKLIEACENGCKSGLQQIGAFDAAVILKQPFFATLVANKSFCYSTYVVATTRSCNIVFDFIER
jgi:hypothetical protein